MGRLKSPSTGSELNRKDLVILSFWPFEVVSQFAGIEGARLHEPSNHMCSGISFLSAD